MVIALASGAIISGIAFGCMVLAWLTDHEAAGSAGCIPPGQVW